MDKARKQYIESCEVSEIAEVNLGGYRQKIAIEGKKKDLPVVICLHGGPGSPVPFSVACRGLFPQLTDQAVMVYWDQLGCGCNNYDLNDDFSLSSFVDMTCDLIKYVRGRFAQNKIFVFAVSWGSLLALGAATRLEKELDGVLIWGQIVKDIIFNEEVYSAFGGAPKKIQKEIAGYKANGKNQGDLNIVLPRVMKLIDKYTDGRTCHGEEGLPVKRFAKGFLTSPDYTLRDLKAIIKNGYRKNNSLWKELVLCDVTSKLQAVKVPYKILQGERDLITPASFVIGALKENKNALLSYKIVPKTGHMPTAAAMETIFDEIRDMVYSML